VGGRADEKLVTGNFYASPLETGNWELPCEPTGNW